MDIQTIITNLRRTIAGKEMLLATYENPEVNPYPQAVKIMLFAYPKVNIDELGKILAYLEEVAK